VLFFFSFFGEIYENFCEISRINIRKTKFFQILFCQFLFRKMAKEKTLELLSGGALPTCVCACKRSFCFLRCEDVSLRRSFVCFFFLLLLSLLLSLGVLANALAALAIVSQSIRLQEKEVDKVDTAQKRPAAVAIHHYLVSLCCFFFC